jgi:hypothetical protein
MVPLHSYLPADEPPRGLSGSFGVSETTEITIVFHCSTAIMYARHVSLSVSILLYLARLSLLGVDARTTEISF